MGSTSMDSTTIHLRDIKELRLARHWSQEQLAEMSGLSVRTIQRIENGENAGLESLKSLAAVFEIELVDSDKNEEIEQARKEEEYVQNVKGLYKLSAVAVFSLLFPLFTGFKDSEWSIFGWMLLSWGVLLCVYSINSFNLFGEDWKRKIIQKKFKKE